MAIDKHPMAIDWHFNSSQFPSAGPHPCKAKLHHLHATFQERKLRIQTKENPFYFIFIFNFQEKQTCINVFKKEGFWGCLDENISI